MKYLTYPYLTLMHAFRDRADFELDKSYNRQINRIALMQEYCTLRIDGGRQSGKSEAASKFAAEWMAEGNSVIVICTKTEFSRGLVGRIRRDYNNIDSIHKKSGALIGDTIRSFLSDGIQNKYRGISLSRTLIIIDEPMNIPEMYKFYAGYENVERQCCRLQKDFPLFFVMGMQ